METSRVIKPKKQDGLHIQSIGHVGGDIVGGDKVQAEKITTVDTQGDVQITDDDDPASMKWVVALGGLIGAIATILAAISALL